MSQELLHYVIPAEVNGTVVTNKCWQIRRALAIVIILLYALITISFAINTSYIRSTFIENGQNFWTVYLKLTDAGQAVFWERGISASLSTLLADLYMVCVSPLNLHQLTFVPALDLVLLDGLGTTLVHWSAPHVVSSFRDRYGVCYHLLFLCSW